MKDIEKIIQDNRDQFDHLEPSEGHFERFQNKLDQHNKKSVSFSWTFIMKAAVVGVLVVLSSMWLYDNLYKQQNTQQLTYQDLPTEVQEAQMYYSSLVEEKYEKIKSHDFEDEKQKKMLLKELKEMNEAYQSIRKDLKSNPDDPRVINALIRHYQMKLDVMNQILNQLKTMNQQNNNKEKSHETTEI
jgi:hypothetical protein